MVDHPITLAISELAYAQAEQMARAADQPIEAVLKKQLEYLLIDPRSRLPPDEQAELEALRYLSDDTLWTIAREQMPLGRQQHMTMLMDRNSAGTITPTEYTDLSRLVDQGQRLMLRKAAAADLLMDRGYPVNSTDMSSLEG